MKFNSAMANFLTSKLVLNIVAILATFNVLGYAITGNLNSVLYFIVFAILVRYFSKNMTIVLGVPLIIVNLLALKGNTLEGMDNNNNNNTNNDTKSSDKKNNTNSVNNNTVNGNNKNNNNNSLNKPEAVSSQGLIMSSVASGETPENNAAQSTSGEQDGFEPGRKKNRGYNIDYATTIEDAYDELNNILGSDGIHRLTNDTQNLMKQQMQLAKAMEGMGKLVENIQPMVGQLQNMMGTNGDSNGGIAGVMDLAKKMTSQAAPVNK